MGQVEKSVENISEKVEDKVKTQRSEVSNSKKEVQFKQIDNEKDKHVSDKRKHSCSEYGLNENEKLLEKGEDGYEEQQERVMTAKTGLRDGEKVLHENEKGFKEQQERIKTAEAKYRDHLQHEEDRLGLRENE